MGCHTETRIGSLIAASGVIWAVWFATGHYIGIDSFSFYRLPRGPMETSAIGILVWLHAKWRHSVQLR